MSDDDDEYLPRARDRQPRVPMDANSEPVDTQSGYRPIGKGEMLNMEGSELVQVQGKRKRSAPQPYTDSGPQMRQPKEVVAQVAPPKDTRERSTREKNGVYAREVLDKRVKYHAELAAIEMKWMKLKQRIRKFLDGKLSTLKNLVTDAYCSFTVHDARKACRHCRETMRAYQTLGASPATLENLKAEEIKLKSHRRVIDCQSSSLKLKANMTVTMKELLNAHKAQMARETKEALAAHIQRAKLEFKQVHEKKKRLNRSEEQRTHDKVDSKARKSKMVLSGISKDSKPKSMQMTLEQMCKATLHDNKEK